MSILSTERTPCCTESQCSPATAVRVRYGTQSTPSQYPGEADAFVAITMGAAANPHASATAARIFMSFSVGFQAAPAYGFAS